MRYFSASFSSLMLSLWLIAQHSSFRLQVTRACLPLLSTRLIYDFSSMHKYLKPKTSVALAFNWLLMKRKLSDSLWARPRSQEWVEMHFYSIFPHWKKMRILFFFCIHQHHHLFFLLRLNICIDMDFPPFHNESCINVNISDVVHEEPSPHRRCICGWRHEKR